MRKITKIVLHHSLTSQSLDFFKTLSSFENTHKERLGKKYGQPVSDTNYPNIAYHYVISTDGLSAKTRNLEDVGYHASNISVNKESIGICLQGNLDYETPTEAQYTTLRGLIKMLRGKHGDLTLHEHKEYAKKTCPGKLFDINKLNTMTPLLTQAIRMSKIAAKNQYDIAELEKHDGAKVEAKNTADGCRHLLGE